MLSERRYGRRNLKQKDGWITKRKELRERKDGLLKERRKGKGKMVCLKKKEEREKKDGLLKEKGKGQGKMDYFKKEGKGTKRLTT